MPLSIDEISKIGHTNAMFERFRAGRPQHFQLTMTIGPWSKDQLIAIPYPITHLQQTVTDLNWNSDGEILDQSGCIVVHHGTWANITASIHTQPFLHRNDQLADHSTIRHCYDQTVAQLRYGAPIPGLYTLNDALTLPEVDCGGFSVYLIDLLAQAGITARLVAGFWAGYKQNGMHAWAEALLPNNTWLPLDPSTDWLRRRHRTTKLGGFGEVGSDRIVINVADNHIIRYAQKDYPVGMLQWPVQLLANGTVNYLDAITRLETTRL